MPATQGAAVKSVFGLVNERRFVFFLFVLALLFLGYAVDRSDFLQLSIAFGGAFAAYFHWLERGAYRSMKSILTDAVIIRVLLLFATPMLSDDYFRFIWDGQLQLMGIDPFLYLPSSLEHGSEYLDTILPYLNSPDYYSVYPPVMQWIFTLAAWVGGEDTLTQVIVMRVILILADIGIILIGSRLLTMLGRKRSDIAIYALNPLVIIELVGNLHFEGLMLFFSISGIYLLMKLPSIKGALVGGAAFALGVVTKLTNILFLPPLLRRAGLRAVVFGLSALAVVAACFYPFITDELVANFGSSLDLYFRNFQFNSSVYALTMEVVGVYVPHYTAQTVGPIMMVCTVIGILLISFIRRSGNWKEYFVTLLFVMFTHLLFASTVHPWYVINLLVVSIMTRYRFPVVWSFMIVFSYFMYGNEYYQPPIITIVEYGVVTSYMLWEIWKGGDAPIARQAKA